MATRRNVLKGTGATTLTIGVAGCLNRLPFVGSDDEDEDADRNEDEGEDTDRDDAEETGQEDAHDDTESSEQEDDPADTDEDDTTEDDADDAEQETEGEDEDSEDDDEEEEKEDTVPDREEVHPDEDDYEDHEGREVVERDPSDIEIAATGTEEENGTVLITGTVTNVSEEYIDAVDIRFEFQDDAGESVGRQLVNVHDIDAGESVEYAEEIFDGEFTGPVETIEVTSIEVYGFEDD